MNLLYNCRLKDPVEISISSKKDLIRLSFQCADDLGDKLK